MHIIRALRQGNSIMVTIPALLRQEMGINRLDHFLVMAKSSDTITYTKLTPRALKRIRKQILGGK